MSDEQPEAKYDAPPLGAYPVDEHLRAQREQTHPITGKPMHEPDADPEPEPEPDAPAEPAPTE